VTQQIFVVHEPNGNLPTPNNSHMVDYFYCMYVPVLPAATPTKTTNKVVYFNFLLYIDAFRFSSQLGSVVSFHSSIFISF